MAACFNAQLQRGADSPILTMLPVCGSVKSFGIRKKPNSTVGSIRTNIPAFATRQRPMSAFGRRALGKSCAVRGDHVY